MRDLVCLEYHVGPSTTREEEEEYTWVNTSICIIIVLPIVVTFLHIDDLSLTNYVSFPAPHPNPISVTLYILS